MSRTSSSCITETLNTLPDTFPFFSPPYAMFLLWAVGWMVVPLAEACWHGENDVLHFGNAEVIRELFKEHF
jgi:hypothetical protein